jgi:hypothetical protein
MSKQIQLNIIDLGGGTTKGCNCEAPDLSDYAKKKDVPTKVSQLENDSRFITKGGSKVRLIDGEEEYVDLDVLTLVSKNYYNIKDGEVYAVPPMGVYDNCVLKVKGVAKDSVNVITVNRESHTLSHVAVNIEDENNIDWTEVGNSLSKLKIPSSSINKFTIKDGDSVVLLSKSTEEWMFSLIKVFDSVGDVCVEHEETLSWTITDPNGEVITGEYDRYDRYFEEPYLALYKSKNNSITIFSEFTSFGNYTVQNAITKVNETKVDKNALGTAAYKNVEDLPGGKTTLGASMASYCSDSNHH